jgi:abequosyltransferase
MNTPLLSICIPTYNFGEFIGAALQSIVGQLPDNAEIVVLDGGSTDDTAEVVRQFQTRCPQLIYHRIEARGGIDRDMARSIDLAQGQFCWLFSADDVMKPNSIQRMLHALVTCSDVYVCKHSICDLHMNVLGETRVLGLDRQTAFDLGEVGQRRRYFAQAQTTEAFFSFMGGLIVKRAKWNSVALNERFVGSCWAHVARLFELIATGLSVTYVPEALLDRRGDNDSFADKGVVNRYRIAIEGYHRLAAQFFPEGSIEAFHIRRVIRNEFKFRTFLAAAMICRRAPGAEKLAVLNQLISAAYCDRPFTGRLIRLGCAAFPSRLYPALRAAYKQLTAPFKPAVGS